MERKSLLPFLTFVNHEGRYFVAVFLHNIVFAQLGLIPRACCRVPLKYKSCRIKTIKQAHVPNMLSCKTTWWKNFYEKGKKLFVPNSQHCQFEQDGWKTLLMKIRWIWTCSQIFKGLSYWEKMLLLWMLSNKTSANL